MIKFIVGASCLCLTSCVSFNSVILTDSNNYHINAQYFLRTETRTWGEYKRKLELSPEKNNNGSVRRSDIKKGFTTGQLFHDYSILYGKDILLQNIRLDIKTTRVFGFKFEKPFCATFDILKAQVPIEKDE